MAEKNSFSFSVLILPWSKFTFQVTDNPYESLHYHSQVLPELNAHVHIKCVKSAHYLLTLSQMINFRLFQAETVCR